MAKDAKDEYEPKLRDILGPIIPKLIEYLIRHAGFTTQEELGDPNTISRYRKGKVVPTANLPKLGAAAGLSLESTAWVIGRLLVEENQVHSVDFDGSGSEVGEPGNRYDQRSLEDELAEIMEFDFTVLEPHKTVELNLERNAHRDACRVILSDAESLIEAHLKLLASFKDRCVKALHEARHGS